MVMLIYIEFDCQWLSLFMYLCMCIHNFYFPISMKLLIPGDRKGSSLGGTSVRRVSSSVPALSFINLFY